MAFLAIASALGFRVHPDEVARAVLSLPGFVMRRVQREGRTQKGEPQSIISAGLKAEDREVMFDFHGRKREEWGFLWATKTKVAKVGDFDITVVNWPTPLTAEVAAAFATLCEASEAEFGYVDEADPFPTFKILNDIRLGVPGVAWAMWAGPQLAAALPQLVNRNCWSAVEARRAGTLLRAGEAPVTESRRREIMACVGAEAFAPQPSVLPFDLSAKNTITPDWAAKGIPPELPPGARIIGSIPQGVKPKKK